MNIYTPPGSLRCLAPALAMLVSLPAGCGAADPEVPDAAGWVDAHPRPDASFGAIDARLPPDAAVDAEPACVDDAEPNDTVPYGLGTFTDSPDTTATFADFNLHRQNDVDLYVLDLSDTGFDGNPQTTITVNVPSGDEYNLVATGLCLDGFDVTTVSCAQGVEVAGENACRSLLGQSDVEVVSMQVDCSGTLTDSGTIEIRIEPVDAITVCENYSLEILVE